MFVISEAEIDERIVHERFACDVVKCKGACCTLPGGRGAPLEDGELKELEPAFPVVRKFLSERHLRAIERSGLYEGGPGSFTTTCVDGGACVFVYYEDDVARCSLEKAFHEGELQWRKPVSCHLFPIRISSDGTSSVRFEELSECKPALVRGNVERVSLYDFLKDALIREFGRPWYEEFRKECHRRDGTQRAADSE